jgi:hypothetical protein
MHHFQFGAGHFALGFGSWIFSKTNAKRILVARNSTDKRILKPDKISPERRNQLLAREKRLIVMYKDVPEPHQSASEQFEIIRLDEFLTYQESRPDMTLLDRFVSQDDPLIFTFSLGNERAYTVPIRYVARALKLRNEIQTHKPIFLVAFENKISTATLYQLLLRETRKTRIDEVIPLESSVDRVCSEISEIGERRRRFCKVLTERHASLVLEDKDNAELKELLKGSSEILFSANIEIEKRKKRWILNGSHALLGICAIYYGFGQFHEYFVSERFARSAHAEVPTLADRQRFAKTLIKELAHGFAAHLAQSESGRAYLSEHRNQLDKYEIEVFERYCSTYDSTDRIMKNYVSPKYELDPATNTYKVVNSMSEFFSWMRPRLDEPVKAYMKSTGTAPPTITLALLFLFELIAGGRFIDTVVLE